jgi:2-polyprenyl-3-methyl-5-hydroxy-6-metoxy-1,4-benzoquinol methylase
MKKKSIHDLKRRVDLVSKITPKNGKILEIGSGYGFFLEEMKKRNYEVIGIEISNERKRISKKITKAKIVDMNIMEEDSKLGKFHTIVLFHVLKHISNLNQFLKNIKKMLYKNGKIVIEVPNYDDYQIKSNYAYKEWNFQRAHIHYFTPKTLKSVLQKNGLKEIKIVGVQRYGIGNMVNWKSIKKPQLEKPEFEFEDGYEIIEMNYKTFLEQNLISDTIMSVSN